MLSKLSGFLYKHAEKGHRILVFTLWPEFVQILGISVANEISQKYTNIFGHRKPSRISKVKIKFYAERSS